MIAFSGQNCSQNDLGDYVAIKILKDGVSNEVKEDFEREVDIMSAFDHENILKLIGIVQRGKLIFIIIISSSSSNSMSLFCLYIHLLLCHGLLTYREFPHFS